MWQIDKAFKDLFNIRKENSLNLNADKPINPYHVSYPILWAGLINGEKVIMKQLTHSSSQISDYEFIEFPDKYNYLRGTVVKAIDNYLKILD